MGDTVPAYLQLGREGMEAGMGSDDILKLLPTQDVTVGREQFRLEELPDEEQVRYCETLRGAATMAAYAANRVDLVARVNVIWGPDH
jgi:hypothetical protein